MINLTKKLRILVLDCPYNIWSESTGSIFSKMVDLKLKGFGKEYANGVLPVDTTDFIATHQLVCLERKNGLIPIMGYKSITLERSKFFNIIFPGLALVRAAQAIPHTQAVESIIKDCEEREVSLAYTGSWTIAPFVREDKDFCLELRDLFSAIYVLFHKEYKVQEIISGGTLRFKADKLISRLGHEPLTLKDQPLPPISVTHLHGENVLVMHLKKFTKEADQIASQWIHLWEDRMTLSKDEPVEDLLILPKAG